MAANDYGDAGRLLFLEVLTELVKDPAVEPALDIFDEDRAAPQLSALLERALTRADLVAEFVLENDHVQMFLASLLGSGVTRAALISMIDDAADEHQDHGLERQPLHVVPQQ